MLYFPVAMFILLQSDTLINYIYSVFLVYSSIYVRTCIIKSKVFFSDVTKIIPSKSITSVTPIFPRNQPNHLFVFDKIFIFPFLGVHSLKMPRRYPQCWLSTASISLLIRGHFFLEPVFVT